MQLNERDVGLARYAHAESGRVDAFPRGFHSRLGRPLAHQLRQGAALFDREVVVMHTPIVPYCGVVGLIGIKGRG